MLYIKNLCYLTLLTIFLTGCSSFNRRIEYANNIASSAGMQKHKITTDSFILTTYSRIDDKNAPINVYIEGDGFAWVTTHHLSSNPTPQEAFTLQLAALDTAPNVIYLARPCQYTPFNEDKLCSPKYWSGSRFAPEVITSVDSAISYYSKSFPNPQINIIGYSGGAAVAALIAAKRNDIITLRTVAGNLDHVAVNKFHGVDNLDNSLNAIDVAGKLASLPQCHFAGEKDTIVPLSVINGFAEKANSATGKNNGCAEVSVVSGATHFSGWKEKWAELLKQPISCKNNFTEKSNKIRD